MHRKEIPGFTGYEAGSDGTIWSCWRRKFGGGKAMTDEWREVAQHNTSRQGHKTVSMWVAEAGKSKTCAVRTLVALAHLGPRPSRRHEIVEGDSPCGLVYRRRTRLDATYRGKYDRKAPYGTQVPENERTELVGGVKIGKEVDIPAGKQGVTYRRVPRCPSRAAGTDGTIWRQDQAGDWHSVEPAMIVRPDKPNPYPSVEIPFGKADWRERRVHQLVMQAHVGPCPEGMQVRHLNDVKTDNRLENLAYGTPAENGRDKVANERSQPGELHWNAKFTNAQVEEIRLKHASGTTRRELAKEYGTHKRTIGKMVCGTTYQKAPGKTIGSTPRAKPQRARVDTEEVVQRYLAGETQQKIADSMHVARQLINRVLKTDSRVPDNNKHRGGQERKLTAEAVAQIQSLADEGWAKTAIAAKMGISRMSVYRALGKAKE